MKPAVKKTDRKDVSKVKDRRQGIGAEEKEKARNKCRRKAKACQKRVEWAWHIHYGVDDKQNI